MKNLIWLISLVLGLSALEANANTSRDAAVPLSHCYHWLASSKGYLDFKYAYAKDNGNELTFFTSPGTSNGSVAGPGLYCAKSPSESYGYGDRILRIELVDDVVMLDALTGKKYCGHRGNFYANDAECQAKDWDIKHYNTSPDWYVIQNPRAVKSWSATTPSLIQDLRTEMSYGGSGYTSHANSVINVINADVQKNGVRDMVNTRARMGFVEIVKDDKLLRSLPALTVLGEFNREENLKKIDADLLAKVLEKTVKRILEDDFLPWSDVKPVLKGNAKIKKAFTAGIQKQLETIGQKSDSQKNFDVMLLFAGQKNSGITADQVKVLITETFKNPSNFGQTRFEKGDLSDDLKNGLVAELTARLQVPETKNDLSLLASLVTFVSVNSIDAQIKKDVTAMYYEFIKTMTSSKFVLSTSKTKYPLGDTVQIATQLCQANIAAYNLVNKDLSIGSGEVKVGVGQISSMSNAAAFCQQQASLMDVLATVPAKGATQVQTLSGQVQAIKFKFAIIDQESMEAQLRAFYKKNNLTAITQLDIYLNGTQLMIYNNYYAIYNDEDGFIAGVFQYVNNTKGLFARNQLAGLQQISAKSKGKSKEVTVTFDDKVPFKFKINNLEDFNEQCPLLAPTLDSQSFAYVRVNVDKQEIYEYFNNLNSATNSCSGARQILLKLGVVSKAEQKANAELARLGKGKKISFKLSFNEVYTVDLKVDNLDELDEQCKLLSPRLEDYTLTLVRWSKNDNEKYNAFSTTSSKTAQTCQELRSDILMYGEIYPAKYYAGLKQVQALGKNKKHQFKAYFGQNFTVDFGIENIEDFNNQCPLIGSALEGLNVPAVSVRGDTVNGDFRNPPAPFTTAKDSCQAVAGVLLNEGIPSKKHTDLIAAIRSQAAGKRYQIATTLHKTEVLFGVNNMEELNSQCMSMGDAFDGRTTSSITYSVNKAEAVGVRLYTYPQTTKEVCDQLKAGLRLEIPSKVIADIAAKKSQSKISFMATIEGLPITFAMNSKSEFAKQCATLVAATGVATANYVQVGKDNSWGLLQISGIGNTPPDQICGKLKEIADYGFLPSDDQLEVLALDRKYTVEATFSGIPFTFKVNSKEQLQGQCLNLAEHMKQTWKIQHRTNGGAIQTSELQEYITINQACRQLSQAVRFY
jgi:hypothetical protein